jgi:hypothetical protein
VGSVFACVVGNLVLIPESFLIKMSVMAQETVKCKFKSVFISFSFPLFTFNNKKNTLSFLMCYIQN